MGLGVIGGDGSNLGDKMNAYWYKFGILIDVPNTHIQYVIDNPITFNLERSWIQLIYDNHKEMLYTEKEARNEIIQLLFRVGWIRIRERKHNWISEGFDINEESKIERKIALLYLQDLYSKTLEKINNVKWEKIKL